MLAAIFYSIEAEPLNLKLLEKGDWFGIACMAVGLGSFIAFLEEGQNQDWFTSTFIQHCFELAVVFIPLFLIIELVGKNPVV
jgi:DHA2 family multidrug resistance protein